MIQSTYELLEPQVKLGAQLALTPGPGQEALPCPAVILTLFQAGVTGFSRGDSPSSCVELLRTCFIVTMRGLRSGDRQAMVSCFLDLLSLPHSSLDPSSPGLCPQRWALPKAAWHTAGAVGMLQALGANPPAQVPPCLPQATLPDQYKPRDGVRQPEPPLLHPQPHCV